MFLLTIRSIQHNEEVINYEDNHLGLAKEIAVRSDYATAVFQNQGLHWNEVIKTSYLKPFRGEHSCPKQAHGGMKPCFSPTASLPQSASLQVCFQREARAAANMSLGQGSCPTASQMSVEHMNLSQSLGWCEQWWVVLVCSMYGGSIAKLGRIQQYISIHVSPKKGKKARII